MAFKKMDLEKNLSLAVVCSLATRWSSGYTDQQTSGQTQTFYLLLIASIQKTYVPINVWFELFSLVKHYSPWEAIVDELPFVFNYLMFIYLPIYYNHYQTVLLTKNPTPSWGKLFSEYNWFLNALSVAKWTFVFNLEKTVCVQSVNKCSESF